MHSQRPRRSQASCPQINNLFSSQSGNPALTQLIPSPILRQLGTKSQITCSSVLSLREWVPGQEFEVEYRRMQLASCSQPNLSVVKEQFPAQQIPNFITENVATGSRLNQQHQQNKYGKTVYDLLADRQFLEKLNELVFCSPFQKTSLPAATLPLQE